jgi:hypothetical protein
MKAGSMVVVLTIAMVATCAGSNLTNTVSFTNRNTVVVNAVAVRWDATKLVYRTAEGGGTVKLADLPRDLQERFGYEPSAAAAAETTEAQQQAKARAAVAAGREQALRAEAQKQRAKQVAATGTMIWAQVIGRTKEGLLLDTDWVRNREISMQAGIPTRLLPKVQNDQFASYSVARGIVLLVDYDRENSVVDGDEFGIVGFPVGTYEYTTVTGAGKTVRKYSANFSKVVAGR